MAEPSASPAAPPPEPLWPPPPPVPGALAAGEEPPQASPTNPSTSRASPAALDAAPGPSTSAPPARHGSVDLSLALTFLRVISLVPLLLAVHERELGLHAALLLVQGQRHQSVPLLLDLAGEAVDLAPVEQQLSPPPRLVVPPVRVRVDTDVRPVQPGLVLVDLAERVDERDLAVADRLDLRPHEHEPRLEDLVDVIEVPRLPVAREHLRLLGFGSRLLGHGPNIPRRRRLSGRVRACLVWVGSRAWSSRWRWARPLRPPFPASTSRCSRDWRCRRAAVSRRPARAPSASVRRCRRSSSFDRCRCGRSASWDSCLALTGTGATSA